MKNSYIIFLLLVFSICQACSSAPEQISHAQQNQAPSPIASPSVQNDSDESYLAEDEDIVNRSGEIQMVFMGYVDFKNGKIVSDNNWSVGEDTADIELKKGMLFDVLTCAGFAASARLKKYHGEGDASNGGYRWEMEFVPGKTSKSGADALAGCRAGANRVRAFAVYPAKSSREKIKIQAKPDLKRVYDSLAARDKKWIASNDPENTGYAEDTKKTPDIEAWTDTDGDGQLDLIEVKGNCNGQPDGDLICMQILHLSNDKWVRVGWLATD